MRYRSLHTLPGSPHALPAPHAAASSTSHTRLGYHPALDGLRALAVTLVAASHAHLLPGGYLGVDVFFALSGFLITALALDEWTATGRLHLRYFLFSSGCRLFPALVVLLLGHLALLVPLIRRVSSYPTTAALRESWYAFGYVMNWGTILDQLQAPFLGHTWSLAVEEQFYLVWPVLLVLLLRWVGQRAFTQSMLLLVLAAWMYLWLLVINGAPWAHIYAGSDTRANLLLIGAAAAAWRWNGGQLGKMPRWLPWAVLGSMVIIIWQARSYSVLVNLLLSPAIALLSVWFVLVVVVPRPLPLRTWLERRPLVWLGQRSYGIYLWHHPVMVLLHQMRLPPVAVLVVGGLISIAIAAASYRFVEQPVMRRARARFRVVG